jgi:hypothetical protein
MTALKTMSRPGGTARSSRPNRRGGELGRAPRPNGSPIGAIRLDATEVATDTIAYAATDLSAEAVGTGVVRGLTSTPTRTVIIETVNE